MPYTIDDFDEFMILFISKNAVLLQLSAILVRKRSMKPERMFLFVLGCCLSAFH